MEQQNQAVLSEADRWVVITDKANPLYGLDYLTARARIAILPCTRSIPPGFENLYIDMVEWNPSELSEITHQTERVCMAAICYHNDALLYVREQTDKLCEYALKEDYRSLQYIRNQTEHLCKFAIRLNPEAIQYVRDQTEDLCSIAVMYDGECIRFVRNQTEELCLLAVQKNHRALMYVFNQTKEICEAAFKKDANAIHYMRQQPEKLCLYAARHSYIAFKGIINKTPELRLELIKWNHPHHCIKVLSDVTEEEILLMIDKDPFVISYFRMDYTQDAYLKAVKLNATTIRHVKTPTLEMCIEAVKQDPRHINLIPVQFKADCKTFLETY